MRSKEWTKKEVKKDIKRILKTVKDEKLNGKIFSLKELIGDYTWDSKSRYIKEALFYNSDTYGRLGSRWHLKNPKSTPKELAKKVMKFTM